MFSKDQQQDVRTSSPSLSGAIFNALFGLPFVGGGLMLASTSFTSNGQSGALVGMLFSALMFLGGGGWIWWKAYKGFRRWRTYGTSHLQMESAPVLLGSSFRVRLRAPISADEQPPNGFQVRVAATRGSGDDEEVVWENWTSVRGKHGTGETEVPLSLDLPARPLPDHRTRMADATPWSSEKNALENLDWSLEVTASFDDKPDYKASFDLPVSVPDDLDEQADEGHSADETDASAEPSDAAPAGTADEEVYWGVDDEDETTLRRTDETGTDDPPDEVEETLSEPVSAGIHVEEGPGRGLTLNVEHARSEVKSSGLMLAGVGTVFTVVGVPALVFALMEGGFTALVFGALSTFGGGIALWSAWKTLTHASTVRVVDGQVEVQKGPFFLDPTPTRFPCDALDDAQVEATAGSGNQSYYTLSLVTNGAGAEETVPVAGMLPDKEEAEWIADRLRQAAEQEAAA